MSRLAGGILCDGKNSSALCIIRLKGLYADMSGVMSRVMSRVIRSIVLLSYVQVIEQIHFGLLPSK